MEAIHGAFTDTIPENYERYLVPLAFDFTGVDLTQVIQFKLDAQMAGDTPTIFIDNLYFYDSTGGVTWTPPVVFGDDLAEGKPTLPLILGRKLLANDGKDVIDQAIREGGIDRMEEVVNLVKSCGALDLTREAAISRAAAAKSAIAALPGSKWKDAMESLASYAVSRRY